MNQIIDRHTATGRAADTLWCGSRWRGRRAFRPWKVHRAFLAAAVHRLGLPGLFSYAVGAPELIAGVCLYH
jgi:hypothetical protein